MEDMAKTQEAEKTKLWEWLHETE